MARSAAQVLDRLVGRAVLAEADRVVRPHVGDRQLHQRGQPDRRPHVVAEDQEGAAVRPGAAVQRDAVEDRAHGVLADAEVQRAAVGVAGERPWSGDSSGMKDGSPFIVVLLHSARSAEPPHSSGRTGREALSTSPEALRVAMPGRRPRRSAAPRPAGGQLAARRCGRTSAARSGLAAAPARRKPAPTRRARRGRRVDDLAGVLQHLVRGRRSSCPGRSRGPLGRRRPRRRRAPSRGSCRCSSCSGRASR